MHLSCEKCTFNLDSNPALVGIMNFVDEIRRYRNKSLIFLCVLRFKNVIEGHDSDFVASVILASISATM